MYAHQERAGQQDGHIDREEPQAASAMIKISSRFTKMMSMRLSYLSASCPLVAGEQQERQDKQCANHQSRHGRAIQLTSW